MIKKKKMTTKFKIAAFAVLLTFAACKKETSKPSEPEYTNFKVLNVKVSAMPFINSNNASWDILNGPDLFFKMETDNNAVIFNGTSSRINDISPASLPLSWDFVNAYQITNLSVTHYVTLYDYDTPDPDDEIGYVGFTMQDHKSGYPKSITKTQNNITVTISGEWY